MITGANGPATIGQLHNAFAAILLGLSATPGPDKAVVRRLVEKGELHVSLEHFQEPKIQSLTLVDLVQNLPILEMIKQKDYLEVNKNLMNVPDMKVLKQLLDVLLKIRLFLRIKMKIYFLSLV